MTWTLNTLQYESELVVAHNGSVAIGLFKAGAPADSDFTDAPPDGTLVLDTSNHRLYIRDGGAWKYASLT